MSETLSKCEHPKFVFNKYINDYVLVPCGKCKCCQSDATKRWVARMKLESQCWQFCFSLYLDYNDDYLPCYDLCGDFLKERQQRFWNGRFEFSDLCFPLSDMDDYLQTDFDKQYFYNRLYEHHTSIPHPSVRDIQNFKKRLNRYLQREVTGRYSNFRSCIAAELGPTTFRPHYHGILFFNDARIADRLQFYVAKAWSETRDGVICPFGHANVEPDRGNTAGYVGKYIKKPADLPTCYTHPSLSPFFLTSRQPSIGSLLQSKTEIQDLFDMGSCSRVMFNSGKDGYEIDVVPLEKTLENNLFPKCPLFSSLTPDVRTQLYKSVIDGRGLVQDFESYILKMFHLSRTNECSFEYSNQEDWSDFLKYIGFKPEWKEYFHAGDDVMPSMLQHSSLVNSDMRRIIDELTNNWSECSRLRTLYSQGCRIWYQSQIFGVSFDYYVSRINLHYQKKELFLLRQFYKQQEEIMNMYPEMDFCFFYPYDYDVDIEKHPLSVAYFDAYHAKIRHGNRTKFKNMYFESLQDKNKDPILYDLIKDYYNGKKCYETLETIA